MPYIKVTYVAGQTVEIEKHFSGRYGKRGVKRGPRRAPTKKKQKEINRRKAVDNLRRLMNANFGIGDWHLVLGYRREYSPKPEESKKHREKFLRDYRAWCKKVGRKVRYIAVTEYKNRRLHHHIVIEEMPSAVAYELWPYGRPSIKPLDSRGEYANLAAYLIKETDKTFREDGAPQNKRWTQSKGLIIPKAKVEVIPAEKWREDPRPPKDHILLRDTLMLGVDDFTGQPWQRYTLLYTGPPKGEKDRAGRGRTDRVV
ncbi:MAG: hypothetical protein J6K98_02795 [Clostridia bacterium]|nr:hypothetical protein [Clostridia bacterium]